MWKLFQSQWREWDLHGFTLCVKAATLLNFIGGHSEGSECGCSMLFWCRVLTLFHPYLEIKDQHVVHLKSLNIKRWIPGIPFDLPATIGTNLEHPQVRTASDGQKLSGMASGPQGVHSECNIIFHHLPAMWCNLTSNYILRAHVLTRRWE